MPGLKRTAAALALGVGCTVPQRPARLPPRTEAFVAVLSGEMPDPISRVSRHAWILMGVPGEPNLRRYEYLGGAGRSETTDPYDYFGDGDVAVHGIVHLDAASVQELGACFDRETSRFDKEHPIYFPIPGPNSNTFVDELLRHCGVRVELPATAIGRDYRGPIGASVTEAGTGVQLETWVLGAKIGIEEGVEVHLFDLPLGVHFWPPGLTVPVNPGRVGIDEGAHATLEQRRSDVRDDDRSPDAARRYGTASAWMLARYAHVARPERAGELTDRLTVGLSGRGIYGTAVGYGIGADLELGAGLPTSFAYGAYFYPSGVAVLIGRTGYLGVFTGIGTSGVTAHVPPALELPAELRLELDPRGAVRFGFRAGVAWTIGDDARRGGGLVAPFADELLLGTLVRFGRTRRRAAADAGHGYFVGLERREFMGSFWLALAFGVEMDAAN